MLLALGLYLAKMQFAIDEVWNGGKPGLSRIGVGLAEVVEPGPVGEAVAVVGFAFEGEEVVAVGGVHLNQENAAVFLIVSTDEVATGVSQVVVPLPDGWGEIAPDAATEGVQHATSLIGGRALHCTRGSRARLRLERADSVLEECLQCRIFGHGLFDLYLFGTCLLGVS